MTTKNESAQTALGQEQGSAGPARILRLRFILGWIALALGTLTASLWAFWGTVENFHEGWFEPELWPRLLGLLRYLSPMLLSMLLTLLGIRFPRLGGGLFFAIAAWFSWWVFSTRSEPGIASVLSWLPVTLVPICAGLLFWHGRPRPLRLASWIALLLPLAVALACSVEPLWRIAHRVNDGDLSAQYVAGNEVELIWAPAGPGWARTPQEVLKYDEAVQRCAHLSADGLSVMEEAQHIWRLPSIEEAVASLTRAGHNAGGSWDADKRRAAYRMMPDKESPLWDPHSTTIYMWTSTEPDQQHAYKIVYNGQVWPVDKQRPLGSHGFRAVRAATAAERASAEARQSTR
jgi:hypothetical protein